MKLPFEWFRALVGHEAAPRTPIEGMPFQAVGEGPPMPTIPTEDDVTVQPVTDVQPIDFEY